MNSDQSPGRIFHAGWAGLLSALLLAPGPGWAEIRAGDLVLFSQVESAPSSRLVELGEVTGDYAAGGYFYRPGGIVHSGPQSGSQGGALWLLRTPTRLTVDFVDGCPET